MGIRKKIGILLISAIVICNCVVGAAESQEITSDEGGINQFVSVVNECLAMRLESLKLSIPGQESDTELLEAAREAAKAEYQKLREYFPSDAEDLMGMEKHYASTAETVKKMYLDGLKLQAEADTKSPEFFLENWERGYCLRACALMEIEQILGVQFRDGDSYSVTEEPVLNQMRSYTGENESQGETAWFIQGFLADQGLMESTGVDGNAGDKTRAILREYLIENNAKIPCVIINKQLIARLITENLLTEQQFDRVMTISTPDGQTIKEKCADPEFTFSALANR